MSQPRVSLPNAEGTACSKQSLNKKGDDASDRKKSQAQRLLEFEMWNNDKTLKDLEYSQRRTEKKQRKKERRRDARHRRWKKLYIPAVLGMVGGTFLTLCATLQSLGGDTVFWDVRSVLIVLGPVTLGLGFLCLMLAAGCTFKHDQHVRQKPKGPPCEFQFLLDGSAMQFQERYHRARLVRESLISEDTGDLPVPEDLDPRRNFVPNRTWLGRNGRKRSTRSSASSSAFLLPAANKNANSSSNLPRQISKDDNNLINNSNSDSSFSAIASWVHSVSCSHTQTLAVLTRQNSDSNLRSSSELCSCGECHYRAPRYSFTAGSQEVHDQSGSQGELHVACARSLTSSGYQSAGDSPTSVGDYRVCVPRENGKVSRFAFSCRSGSFPNRFSLWAGSAAVARNLFAAPRWHGMRRGSLDSGTRQTNCVRFVREGTEPLSPRTGSFKGRLAVDKSANSDKPGSTPGLQKQQINSGPKGENYPTRQKQGRKLACVSSGKPANGIRDSTDGTVVINIDSQSHDRNTGNVYVEMPFILESVGTFKCTPV